MLTPIPSATDWHFNSICVKGFSLLQQVFYRITFFKHDVVDMGEQTNVSHSLKKESKNQLLPAPSVHTPQSS